MHTLEPCDFVVVGAGFTGALLARRLADEDFRVAFETLTLKKYWDFLPLAEQFRSAYFERRRTELRSIAEERGGNYE